MTPLPETVDLAPWLVVLIGGTLIPLLTGLLTKQAASSGLKAAVSIALSAALAAVAPILATGSFHPKETLVLFVGTFATQVLTYYGLWRPMGGGTSPTQRATPDIGIGPSTAV